MQHTAPKQTKLLGATVRGFGVIVAVSSTLSYGYAIVEGADRVNHRVAFMDLKRDEIVFPLELEGTTKAAANTTKALAPLAKASETFERA